MELNEIIQEFKNNNIRLKSDFYIVTCSDNEDVDMCFKYHDEYRHNMICLIKRCARIGSLNVVLNQEYFNNKKIPIQLYPQHMFNTINQYKYVHDAPVTYDTDFDVLIRAVIQFITAAKTNGIIEGFI